MENNERTPPPCNKRPRDTDIVMEMLCDAGMDCQLAVAVSQDFCSHHEKDRNAEHKYNAALDTSEDTNDDDTESSGEEYDDDATQPMSDVDDDHSSKSIESGIIDPNCPAAVEITLARLKSNSGTLQEDWDSIASLNKKMSYNQVVLEAFLLHGGVLRTLEFMEKYKSYDGCVFVAAATLGFVSSQQQFLRKYMEQSAKSQHSLTLVLKWSKVTNCFTQPTTTDAKNKQHMGSPVLQLWGFILSILQVSSAGTDPWVPSNQKRLVAEAGLSYLREFQTILTADSTKIVLNAVCIVCRDNYDSADDAVCELLQERGLLKSLVTTFGFRGNAKKLSETKMNGEFSTASSFYWEDEDVIATLVDLFCICLYNLDEDKLQELVEREVKVVLRYITSAMQKCPQRGDIYRNAMTIIEEVRGNVGDCKLINMGVADPLHALLKNGSTLPKDVIKKGRALYLSLCSNLVRDSNLQKSMRNLKANDVML